MQNIKNVFEFEQTRDKALSEAANEAKHHIWCGINTDFLGRISLHDDNSNKKMYVAKKTPLV